jgi:hypothetical protein
VDEERVTELLDVANLCASSAVRLPMMKTFDFVNVMEISLWM